MRSILRSILVVLTFICTVHFSNAQVRCASTTYLHEQMQADTALAARMLQIEQFTQNYIQNHPNGNNSRAVVTIPVVFHVLYATTAQNITDAKCQAQVDQLNLDYARLNTDAANTPSAFAAVAVNTNIQFCLAVRDPNGAATTGVIHKATTSTSFSTNDAAKYTAQGGDNAWPAASYLNIWSCNLGGGLLGYSQFPGGAAATDGCVILYSSIGSMLNPTTATPYNIGRTATHEVGHWLNLYHVWGDDGSACTGSDQVGDTPNQSSENYGCPTFPHTDACTAASPGVQFMNYMDYVDDACMNMFSAGQSARMNALFATGGARAAILNSQGCVAVGPACAATSGLTTTAIATTSATFTWAAVSGASSYVLHYRIVGTATWTTVTVNSTTYNVTGLTANSNYEWQVQTVCSNGGSASFTSSATFTTLGPPVANFVADVTTSCTGLIHFTDLSTGNPTTWAWNFGDGTTATTQNPTHQYFTNGTFTVALTVSNSNGFNTATKTSYITISKPAAPTTAGGSHCGPGTVSLSSPATDTIKWYANATDLTPVAVANPFVTPSISNTTTYYAEQITAGPIASVGPAANTTLGNGGYFSNSTDQYLIFNCFAPCTLKSVLVYAQAAGTRVIALRNSAGTTLQSLSTNLTAGANTVTLNFALPVGTGLELGVNGTANLYRNNAVTTGYPFTLAGLVSITSSSAGNGYYYYCYNWQIQGGNCISLRASATATITAGLTTSASSTNANCFGAATGGATLTVNGGTPNYTYAWSNGQTSSALTNVGQGTYTVVVTDASGCSGTQSVSISQPTQLLLNVNGTNASCGLTNGTAAATTSGGSPSYSFLWSSNANNATTSAVSNLSTGTYSVTVTDTHNCTTTSSTSITTSGSLTIAPVVTAVSCFGGNNGVIQVSATGGTPAYNYVWGGGQTGNQLTGLTAGTYNITATDGSGCSAIQAINVTQPTQLNVTATSVNAGCGQANGSASALATGGTPNYAYAWDNGSPGSTITGLSSGTYTVTATDNSGCVATSSASIGNSASLVISASSSNALCFGDNSGTASTSVSGGSPSYTYVWSNGGTTSSISNLSAGNYVVTVTDASNCNITTNATVSEPSQLGVVSHSNQPLCNGEANGTIYVTANGGTSGYNYLWSTTATTNTISNLMAGTYAVTVTDANSCTTLSTITLTEPQPITTTFSVTNVTCFGGSTGSVSVAVSGGTPTYTYAWNSGSTSPGDGGLTAGNYVVTITDIHTCTALGTVTVTQPNPLSISTTYNNSTTGQSNGSASVQNIVGAVDPVTFLWSTTDTSRTVADLAAGTYTVTITDGNGCTQSASVTISEETGINSIGADISFNIYPNPASAEVTISIDNVKGPGMLVLKNALGQKLSEEPVKPNTSRVTLNVSKLAAGAYFVELRSGASWAVKQMVITR